MWDDIQAWWANLDEEKKRVLADAVIGQAGVEGNQALREPITPNLAGEIAEARIPPPTPLEEKGAYMEGRGGYDAAVTAMNAPKKEDKTDKDDDLWNQIFLMSLMEEMQGGDPGQAPGVVTGGGFGGLPSMMGQFKRQRKPWWIV